MSDWEEAQGNGGGEFEQRESLKTNIGSEFEGVFVRMSKLMPSKFGGDMRYVDIDSDDGGKYSFIASKILLERLESLGLAAGDRIKVKVESATSKNNNTYALPRVFVKRGVGQAAPAAKPAPEPKSAPVADDDNPPF